MTAPLSPGQIDRDAHYAAAMWLISTDPGAARAILRVFHDTLPPAPQCEAPASGVKRCSDSSITRAA